MGHSDSLLKIGVDEAGYGPNLGPLVVAASGWRVEGVGSADLFERLADAVTQDASRTDHRVQIADSKAVYKPGGGLAALEKGVLGSLAAGAGAPGDWRALVETLGADPTGTHDQQPWRGGHNPELPVDTSCAEVNECGSRLRSACGKAGVTPPRLAARLVFPEEFNALVDTHGTKGAALSHTSLELARRLLDAMTPNWIDTPVTLTLDKHGGRNRYGALVQHWFSEAPLEVLVESRPLSRYRVGEQMEIVFRSKGEEELPVALGSMTAKFLRELSMIGFNAYWAQRVPGIQPTAGYPVDAKRFHNEVSDKQAELGINDRALWRSR